MHLSVSGIARKTNFAINNLKYLHPEFPFKSVDFRPGYFSFLFVKNAKGKYTTDGITFSTEPGTIYFTNPGHFKSFWVVWDWWSIPDYVYGDFLKENVHHDVFKEFPFLLSEKVYPRTLQLQEQFATFEVIYLQMEKEPLSFSAYKTKYLATYWSFYFWK
jgi:AraC family transcriptional regulator, transcriptional activator of pobA